LMKPAVNKSIKPTLSPGQIIAHVHRHVTRIPMPAVPHAATLPKFTAGQTGLSRMIQKAAPGFRSILNKPPTRQFHSLRQPISIFRPAGGRTAQLGYSPMARWTRARNFASFGRAAHQAHQQAGLKLGGISFLLATGLFGMQDDRKVAIGNLTSLATKENLKAKLTRMDPIACGKDQVELDIQVPVSTAQLDALLGERAWTSQDVLSARDLKTFGHHLSQSAQLWKWLLNLQRLDCTLRLKPTHSSLATIQVVFPVGYTPLQVRGMLHDAGVCHFSLKCSFLDVELNWESDSTGTSDLADMISQFSDFDHSFFEQDQSSVWQDVPTSERRLLQDSMEPSQDLRQFISFVDELLLTKDERFTSPF
jgi:hypothetical protein